MNIKIDLIPLSTPYKRRTGEKRVPTYIVIHNTGNPKSTAKNERLWLTNPENKRQASYNYVVDYKNVIQVIPDTEVTWNATDGRGNGNIHGIAIEICESGDYKTGEANAIWLIAKKMIEYNISIENVLPHKHFYPAKDCPRIILPYWGDFIDRVRAELERQKAPIIVKKETIEIKQNETVNVVDPILASDVNTLVNMKIIKSPEYWINAKTCNSEYVHMLISNMVTFIMGESDNLRNNVEVLFNMKIIFSPEYWNNTNIYNIEYIHMLIHNMAVFIDKNKK